MGIICSMIYDFKCRLLLRDVINKLIFWGIIILCFLDFVSMHSILFFLKSIFHEPLYNMIRSEYNIAKWQMLKSFVKRMHQSHVNTSSANRKTLYGMNNTGWFTKIQTNYTLLQPKMENSIEPSKKNWSWLYLKSNSLIAKVRLKLEEGREKSLGNQVSVQLCSVSLLSCVRLLLHPTSATQLGFSSPFSTQQLASNSVHRADAIQFISSLLSPSSSCFQFFPSTVLFSNDLIFIRCRVLEFQSIRHSNGISRSIFRMHLVGFLVVPYPQEFSPTTWMRINFYVSFFYSPHIIHIIGKP